MNKVFKKIEWKNHAIGLSAFCLSCIFLGYAYMVYDEKLKTFTQTQNQLQQQKNINRNAREKMEVYEQYFPLYGRLEKNGVVGTNYRLQWIETLKKISEIYRVPGIDFTLLNAEEATDSNEQYYNDQLPLKTTKMDLSLDLLHEGDWYNVLNYLHQHGRGVFSVQECELVRVSEGKSQFGGIDGKCSLKWYTMQDIAQDMDGET